MQPMSPHVNISDASSVRFVCDTMLQGLGKKLRRFGIDTVILENYDDHMKCVRLAEDERFILTRGLIFNKVRYLK